MPELDPDRLAGEQAIQEREPLTERELELLRCCADGLTREQTAKRVFLAETSVSHALRRVYVKLGARNRPHAVAIAFRTGLLDVAAGGDQGVGSNRE